MARSKKNGTKSKKSKKPCEIPQEDFKLIMVKEMEDLGYVNIFFSLQMRSRVYYQRSSITIWSNKYKYPKATHEFT